MKKLVFMLSAVAVMGWALSSCTDKGVSKLPVFDIGAATAHPLFFDVDQLIESIEYFPLGIAQREMPIGRVSEFRVHDNIIILTDPSVDAIHVFNLQEGTLIHKINRRGRGPEEYTGVYNSILFDDRVYVESILDDFLVYDLNGKYLKTISLNHLAGLQGNTRVTLNNAIPERFPMHNYGFAVYHFNTNGLVDKLITIYDENGNVVKEYPNKRVVQDRRFVSVGSFSEFYAYKDNILFREQSNDTTYRITDRGLLPYMILQLNNNQRISYEDLDWRDDENKVFYYTFKETSQYTIATTQKSGGVYFCHKDSQKAFFYPYSKMNRFAEAIFHNAHYNKQYSESFYTLLQPEDYLDALADGSLPVALQSLKLQEEDNPVILKITFKDKK